MLDERLKETINKKSGNILIIGPPGSGKTYTLLKLTEYLVNTRGIKPEKILIFCFNRKWSKQIREQSTSLINKSILEIPIETFYSFCTHFISRANFLLSQNQIYDKNHYKKINNKKMENYPIFEDLKVLNSVQQWELLKSVIRKLNKEKYPRTFKYINCNTFAENSYIQEIFDFILRAQENLLTPEDLLNRFTPFFNPVLSELSGIYSRYIKELKSNRLYNYGMLLEETVGILRNSEEIRNYYKNHYEFIFVDELQEINKAQFSIIKYLSNSNCVFFGNDDQSIYSFRGSAQNIFRMTYKELGQENVIYLKKNYRNSYFINEACNKFIELVQERIPKEAATTVVTNTGGELHLKEFQTLLEEANYISREIKSLYFKKGIKLEEMAIIIKGLGYETHIIENSLLMNGIPFIRRGTRNLFDNKLIKYLLNFMRFLVTAKKIEDFKEGNIINGDGNINNDLITELNFLVESLMLSEFINLEPLYFKQIKDFYMSNSENSGSLWNSFKIMFKEMAEKSNEKGNKSDEGVLECEESEIITKNYKKNKNVNYYGSKNKDREHLKIINFVSTTYRLLEIVDTMNVFEFSLSLIRDSGTGVMNYLKAVNNGGNNSSCDDKNNNGDNNKDKNENMNNRNSWINLGDFLNNVKDFSMKNTPGDVTSYINFIDNVIESKFTEEIEESTKDMIQPGAVNIFSFHQCKGLEFKVVFIPFVNKDYLPAKFVFNSIYDPGIFSQTQSVKNSDIAWLKKEHMYGEIRLFYNGITRARDYLYITSTGRRKSIFFEEMRKISENPGSELHCKEVHYKSAYGYKNNKSDKKNAGEREEKEGKCNVENKKILAGLKVAAEQLEESTEQNVKIPGADLMDSLLDDIDLTNIWLVRRKALVAILRMQNDLKINYRSYRNYIIFLKHFYNPHTWWDLITPTRNDKNPFEFSGQSFSFSSIDTFTDCPLKYKVRYYFSLKEEEDINLIIGKIYHNIIRIFFNGGNDYSWERLEKIIEAIFEESDFNLKFLKKDFKENALIQFKNFFENLMPSDPQNSITEKEFSFNIRNENITGRIDQINIIDDRDIEIVDYKSGSSSYSDSELKEELQLKTYRMAVDVSEDLEDFKSMNVKMKYICLGNLKKPVYIVPEEYYNRDEISHRLGESISGIKKEEFKAKPRNYNSCVNCGFKILCPRYYG